MTYQGKMSRIIDILARYGEAISDGQTAEKVSEKVIIYGLYDPRDNELRYIGQTKDLDTRLRSHISDKRGGKRWEWIKGLRGIGLKPAIWTIEIVNAPDANTREQYWINHFRNEGIELLNHSAQRSFTNENPG